MTDAPLLDPEEPLPREGSPALDGRGRLIQDVEQADINQKSGRGAIISLSARVANLMLTLVAQGVLGRLLAPSQYGIYAMGMTAFSFLLIFREFGLGAAGVQKKTLSQDEASFLFWVNLMLVTVLAAIGMVASPLVAHFYGTATVMPVLIAMSAAALVGDMSAQHTMILRRQLRFSTIAVIDVTALACGIAAGLTVGFLRRDVWALVAMYMTQQIVTSALSSALSGWWPGRPVFDRAHLDMLRFGGGVAAANVLYFFTNNISVILIGRELGSTALGHFNRAQQLNAIPSTVLFSSVYIVVFASLSRLMPDPAQYRLFYKATLRRVGMFYMFLSGALISCGVDLVYVLLGPGWTIAGQVLSIFAIALVGSGMAQMSGMLYQSQGRIRDFQVWGIIDSVIRVSCIVFSARWGLFGLAFGFALSTTFITAPGSLWYVGRKGPVSLIDQVDALRPALLIFLFSAAGAGGVAWLLAGAQPGFLPLVAKCFGSLGLCLALGMLLPITRAAFIEIVGGLYSIAGPRVLRFLPFRTYFARAEAA